VDFVSLLHQHGCPWDETLAKQVIAAGRVDIVTYLHAHGCPLPGDALAVAIGPVHRSLCPYQPRANPPSLALFLTPAPLLYNSVGNNMLAMLAFLLETVGMPPQAALMHTAISAGHMVPEYLFYKCLQIHR